MPIMSGVINPATGTTTADQAVGQYRQLPAFDSNRRRVRGWAMRLSATSDAAGATTLPITARWTVGPTMGADDVPISRANRFPQPREDVVADHVGAPLDLMKLTFTNPSAATVVVYWRIDLAPIY